MFLAIVMHLPSGSTHFKTLGTTCPDTTSIDFSNRNPYKKTGRLTFLKQFL
jgi:hypothetical protein